MTTNASTLLPLSDLPAIEQRIDRACAAYARVTGRGEQPAPALVENLLGAVELRANVLRPFDANAPVYARANASTLLRSHGSDAVRRQYGSR